MGGSSSQAPTQTSSSTQDPWSGVQGPLSTLYGNALNHYTSDVGYHPYGGNLQAPVNDALNLGLASEYNLGLGNQYGTPGVNAARTLGTNMIQNEGLSGRLKSLYEQAQGDQNPYLQSILDTSNRRIGDKVNAAMSGSGRYGSGAHTDVMSRALAESADPILAQDYDRRQQQMQAIAEGGLTRAGQWSQLMPTLDEAQYAPAYHMQNYGKFFQDRAQQDIANQVATWNAQQSRDWEQDARLANILSGAGGLGGTKVTSQNAYQPTTLQKIGGGAIAGAGLGSMFGPAGAGVGALGGGLLGLL